MSYSDLQKFYNASFEEVDSLAKKYKLDRREGATIAETASQLFQLAEIYSGQIDKMELALIMKKINFYIGSLARDSHSNVLNIYYFNKNKNNRYNDLTSTFYSLNIQLKFLKGKIKLDDTEWGYFQRDIIDFPETLQQKFREVKGPERNSLFFLLLSSIECIHSSLIIDDRKFHELMVTIFSQLKTILNDLLNSETEFVLITESSSGFLIYLDFLNSSISNLIIKEEVSEKIKGKINSLNFQRISSKTLAFYLLNRIKINNGISNEIEELYKANEEVIKNEYPYLNFFISTSIRFKDKTEKFIGIDIDFNKIKEGQLEIIITQLTEKEELKKEHPTLEKIGKIIDWGKRLESLMNWYHQIPIEMRVAVFSTILKVVFG
jgi:hypothetical protein